MEVDDVYVKSSGPGLENIKKAISFLKKNQVKVGIPAKNAGRGGPLNNVELAYLHTEGSPVMHIPPRPFLIPGVEKKGTKDQIARHFRAAAIAAVEGDNGSALGELHKAGIAAENSVKSMFGGELAPNAPITVEGGWMRNRVSGKPVLIKGKGSSAPLIDTGSLRSAVTHIVGEE